MAIFHNGKEVSLPDKIKRVYYNGMLVYVALPSSISSSSTSSIGLAQFDFEIHKSLCAGHKFKLKIQGTEPYTLINGQFDVTLTKEFDFPADNEKHDLYQIFASNTFKYIYGMNIQGHYWWESDYVFKIEAALFSPDATEFDVIKTATLLPQ